MTAIDTDFEGDRFLIRVPLPDGTIIRLLADTGGGYCVDPERVRCLPDVKRADGSVGVRLPITPPMPAGHDVAALRPPMFDSDGIVNAWWFTDRIWLFDYRAGQLHTLDTPLASGTPLGLARTADGDLTSPFPRIQVTVEDEAIDLLLDTGATIRLTDTARKALGDPELRASSFIVQSYFDRWHHQHPDWRIIERASCIGESPLLEVPELTIGDATVGPVWFERRPDNAFHQWMSQWMDQRVNGALGASAYGNRQLIIDYSNARVALR